MDIYLFAALITALLLTGLYLVMGLAIAIWAAWILNRIYLYFKNAIN